MDEIHCKQSQELVPVKEEHVTEPELLPPPSEPRFDRGELVNVESTCGDSYYWQGSYFGDHTYAIMCPLTEVNFKQEANVQYSLAECVKEDSESIIKLKQLSCSDIAVCEDNEMLARPYIDMLKDELVPIPDDVNEPLRSDSANCEASKPTSPYTNMLKDELVLIPEHVKEHLSSLDSLKCEVSKPTSPYTNMLKDELVLIPEYVKEHLSSLDSLECEVSKPTSPYTNMLKDELVLIPEHVKEHLSSLDRLECEVSKPTSTYTNMLKDELVPIPEHVKEHLSSLDSLECEVSKPTSPYTNMLKDELVVIPEYVKEHLSSLDSLECEVKELTSPYTNMPKNELVVIPEQVKEECGMNEATIVANLYTDHAVKDELVLGPEHPHRPDVTLAVRSWALADADSWSAMPASVRTRLKQLKDCSVRLERLPSDAAILAGNQTKETTHAGTKSVTEKKYMSRQLMCGLCGEAFTLKADLIKHVMRHIHMPTSMEEEERPLPNYEKLRSSIRDCWVKLERCDSTNYKPADTFVLSSEKDTAMQKIHTAEINDYICDICSKTFQEKHSLVAHIKMHRSHMIQKNKNVLTDKLNIHECKRKRPYTCELCKKVFRLHRELIRHEIKHSGQKLYSCLICFKRFARMDYIKLHTEIVHNNGEKTFSCEICQRKFKRLIYLERHKLIHTNRQPYYCTICNKPFKSLDYFKRHTNIHIERKHQCQLCYKKFTFSSCLKRHQRVHDGLRPYSCEICSKNFALLDTLKNHLRTHTGQKPYECKICKKRFTQLSCLKSHTILHEGIKHFKCVICSKSFTQSSSLNRHRLTHVGEKKHRCEICDKRFLLPHALKQHIKNIHIKP